MEVKMSEANGGAETEIPRNEQDGDRPPKRVKLEHEPQSPSGGDARHAEHRKGVAPIKKEYLVEVGKHITSSADVDDDAAEERGKADQEPEGKKKGGKGKGKGGQNTSRHFGSSRDAILLCGSRVHANEFDPQTCDFGAKCRFSHDIRKYLAEGKRGDLTETVFAGTCPVFEAKGECAAGWKCRFAGSHSTEIDHDDGRKELVLVSNSQKGHSAIGKQDANDAEITNIISNEDKVRLRDRKFPKKESDSYVDWLNFRQDIENRPHSKVDEEGIPIILADERARYREAPLKPSEKRRIYYGPETPVLAPLTTQGNLPFRRLCVSLGAEITWSEMAMSIPLLKGEKGEWALMKAHQSELTPPKFTPRTTVLDYDNSRDIKFGAQISAHKPWPAIPATQVITSICPNLRAVDLNCGCPIDMVFNQGGGSALLDSPGKLEKMLRGMNAVSNEVPITVKIRMGTKDKSPNAEKLCQRLVLGENEPKEGFEGPAGVAAITLHGRSRQQRYTRSADWEYIASCANLVKKLKHEQAKVTDTIREPDARDLPITKGTAGPGLPYFIGNGDVLSYEDWNRHIEHANVDSCMIGRGALVKPWIFEEIALGQYLDKSGSQRLELIEQFVHNGLDHWGSDEVGVGLTRRFLLEWLSFSCRYVPVGLLEVLPPRLGDRPPAYRGRDDKEDLLSSGNYKDWIKISEMFLGPAHENFHFEPKHKSNSYEAEG